MKINVRQNLEILNFNFGKRVPLCKNLAQEADEFISENVANSSNVLKNFAKKIALINPFCKKITPNDFVKVEPDFKYSYYRFKNSKPLQDFSPFLNVETKKRGISTVPYIAETHLRATDEIPLGTSGIGNCAVACFYNKKNKTQVLYHVGAIKHNPISAIKKNIEKIIPEGFDKVFIIPGCNSETKNTAVNIFGAVKKIDRNCKIEFRHLPNVDFAELIFYKGEVFAFAKEGDKALFELC